MFMFRAEELPLITPSWPVTRVLSWILPSVLTTIMLLRQGVKTAASKFGRFQMEDSQGQQHFWRKRILEGGGVRGFLIVQVGFNQFSIIFSLNFSNFGEVKLDLNMFTV